MAGDGWPSKNFGDCALLVRDSVSPVDAKGLPYVGLEHIGEGRLALIGIGTAEDVTSLKSRFYKGDILFGKLRPYFRKVILAPCDGVCSTDIWVVRPKDNIDARFLFYWMASKDFVDAATRGSEGTKMPRAQWEFVSRLERQVPPLRHQQAIACILGALDDKIELNRRMNRTLEEMARAIFKSWFVDFDPVRAKAAGQQPPGLKPEIAALFPDSFEPSELGEIPTGWSIGTIGELCEKPQYGFTASAREEPIGFKFLRIKDINKLAWINWSTVPFCEIEPSDLEKYRLHIGDILIARMADPGHSAIIEEQVEAVFASYLIRFRLKDNAYTRYTQYWLRSKEYWDLVTSRGAGTTRASLNAHVLSSFQLIVPPKPIASAFGVITNGLRDKILLAVNESVALAALRDTLLPKLISGELRVPDVERIAGRCL